MCAVTRDTGQACVCVCVCAYTHLCTSFVGERRKMEKLRARHVID